MAVYVSSAAVSRPIALVFFLKITLPPSVSTGDIAIVGVSHSLGTGSGHALRGKVLNFRSSLVIA
jgi:hypothetical protein